MRHSKQTISFAKDLVSEYSMFDKLSQSYTLRLEDISDFDLHEFSTFFMSEDESRAVEATGPDNPSYETKMLPALNSFMKNTTSRDNQIEFNKVWSDGIASYFYGSMKKLLDELCSERTYEEFNDSSRYERHNNMEHGVWTA